MQEKEEITCEKFGIFCSSGEEIRLEVVNWET